MRERVAITLALSVAGTAFAGTFSELESNNTIGTANSLGLFDVPGGSVVIDAYLGDNDVDWYSFTLADTSSLAIFAAFSAGSSADGILQLVTDSHLMMTQGLASCRLSKSSHWVQEPITWACLGLVMWAVILLIPMNWPMASVTAKISVTNSLWALRSSPHQVH